jgi:transcriptional regulator with GAF, ATPase, and Fis domain
LQFPGAASEPPKASHRRADAIELPLDGSVSLEEMEKQILHAALERSNGSVSAAARLLGASRETVRYRVNKFGLKFRE